MSYKMEKEIDFVAKARQDKKGGSGMIITIPKHTWEYCKIKVGQEIKLKLIYEEKSRK